MAAHRLQQRMNPFEQNDKPFDRASFSGVCRLFPIPNLVMLPHVVQPLHIFEERYREMMADAIAGDGLIAMPVLKPGWEPDYPGRPPVETYACLGKVVLHNKLPDECYNLLLLGVARVRIQRELEPLRSFRQVEAELVDEANPNVDRAAADKLRDDLVAAFDSCIARGEPLPPLDQLLHGSPTLPQLTDLIAYALPLELEFKYALLAESCALVRGRLLLKRMCPAGEASPSQSDTAKGFPPPFSMN